MEKKISIHPLNPSDLSIIYKIEQEHSFPWTKQLLQDCLQPDYENWVLKLEDEIIGFVITKIILDESELLNISIKQTQRRQGFGKLLLQHIIAQAQEKNRQKIFLEVRASNKAAIALYKQAGFKKLRIRKEYYPLENGREDAIVMCVTIP